MAKFSIPKGREMLYKRIGFLCVAVVAVYMLLKALGGGSPFGSGDAVSVRGHEQYVLSGKDGYKYRRVSYEPYTGPKERATFVTP